LRPKSRELAGRQLEELAREVGGTVVVETRGVVPGSYVELVLSRDSYPKLEAGLHQIGDLRIERRDENLPEQIQVSLRIE
jgi:hypothetical protein